MNALIRDGALRYLRSLEATCDVTIICQHNVKLMAHKIVLGIGSALLQDILLDCHCCQNMTILLPQISSRLVSLVLDFVYTGSIIVSTESDYKDFLEVAQMLKLHNIDIKNDTTHQLRKTHHQHATSNETDINKLQSDNRDETKDNVMKDEKNESDAATGDLVPAVRITQLRRSAQEVRNKVLPSPWKSRSPKHFVSWSYSQCRSRYSTIDYSSVNDSNNNDVAEQARRKDTRVGEEVLSLAASYYHPANNEDSDAIRPCNVNYGQTIFDPASCTDARYKGFRLTVSQNDSSTAHTIPILSNESETTDSCTSSHEVKRAPHLNVLQEQGNCSATATTQSVSAEAVKLNSRTEDDDRRPKVYTCKECGKTFTQLRNYKYHRSIHDGSGEFAAKCIECGKTFNDRGYLRSHMKIHKDKKEYACNFCPKRFNQRVAYNMHLRIHTGVKPHECSTCGKSFSRKMLLKQHERVHTGEKPFVCPQCGKSFADRSNMMLHARLHTGEKPYTCNICQKSFTKKHHLKTHINFHTGIKPYVCKSCGLTFSQSSNMKTHFKKCNGNGGSEATHRTEETKKIN